MTRFIRLTSIIVNTSKLIKIESYKNKYYMYMTNKNINGYVFLSFGSINSSDDIIEICKDKHPIDYQIITKWINQINQDF